MASAGSATQPLEASLPAGLCPGLSRLPESEPWVRDSVSTRFVFSSFSRRQRVAFQTRLLLLSIGIHRSFNGEAFGTRPVPGTMLSREDMAANKIPASPAKKHPWPHGAVLQVETPFHTPLPSQDLCVGQERRGLLLPCSHLKGRGATQNHTQAGPRPLCLAPQVGSMEHSSNSLDTTLPRAQEAKLDLIRGKVLTPINTHQRGSFLWSQPPLPA